MDRELKIGDVTYTLKLTRERQIMNGAEGRVAVDPVSREIRLSSHVRGLVAKAISAARQLERDKAAAARTSQAESPRRRPWGQPVNVSGCFRYHLLPFSWWRQ